MTATQKNSIALGAGCWLGYLSLLTPLVVYMAVRFAALYPAASLTTEPELSQQYKVFVGMTGLGLAVCLGLGAAAFGVWRTSVVQGLIALVLGASTTIAALSVIPPVRFPEDAYPPAALWVMADTAPLIVAFALATLCGWLIRRGHRQPSI